jgi:hypothetical protein
MMESCPRALWLRVPDVEVVGRCVAACAVSCGDSRSRVRVGAQLPGQRAFARRFLQKIELDENFPKK